MSTTWYVISYPMVAFIFLVFGIALNEWASKDGEALMKAKLVEKGAAFWQVNPENGLTTWKWKEGEIKP